VLQAAGHGAAAFRSAEKLFRMAACGAETNPIKPPTPHSAIQFVTSVPAALSLLIGTDDGGARSFSGFPWVSAECSKKAALLSLWRRLMWCFLFDYEKNDFW
jgi:hypothetical protein